MAKNCPETLSAEELKKNGDAAYVEKTKEDARLLELYNNNKLTNKNTIRKARALAQKYNKSN